MLPTDIEQREDIYTVSRLNHEVKDTLEDTFPQIWVEGEISNFAAPGSGHWYFSLKDAAAQVRCAMFRGSQRKLNFTPKDGLHILIRARVSLYPNRGEYQLIAEHMEERGEGKLRRAYELLKKKLEAAGLFDIAHKKSFPHFPTCIGVVTSPTGAAIRDILTVLKRRYACVPVIIYPTLVQGATAAPNIVNAIQIANARNECDVLIVARGGGSLEDLWPFNEEIVAHAIYNSKIPIISGVGHEVDFTIADFVADKRAATPSAAAEIITPSARELLQMLARNKQQIMRQIRNKLESSQQHLDWMQKHLAQQHPKRRLTEKFQQLAFCEARLIQLQHNFISQLQHSLQVAQAGLDRQTPIHHIHNLKNRMSYQQQLLCSLMTKQITKQQTALANAGATLDALSPLATLKRGYAIAQDSRQHVLHDATILKPGDEIKIRLLKGFVDCIVAHVGMND